MDAKEESTMPSLSDEEINAAAVATFLIVNDMPDDQVNGSTWDLLFARAVVAADRKGRGTSEPVAWRVRYRSEPGMIGHYPWSYQEKKRGGVNPSFEEEPLYLGAPSVQEGCTPTDARVLREANHGLAQESHELQDALADLYRQVKEFCEAQGEADFETGRSLHLLSRLRPLEFVWPFSEAPPERAAPSVQEPTAYTLIHNKTGKLHRTVPAGKGLNLDSWELRECSVKPLNANGPAHALCLSVEAALRSWREEKQLTTFEADALQIGLDRLRAALSVGEPGAPDLRKLLRIAFDAMLEADKFFSETDDKCLSLVHAIKAVGDALVPDELRAALSSAAPVGEPPIARDKLLGYELAGVIADVEQGKGFDAICLETVKRVRAALASGAAPSTPIVWPKAKSVKRPDDMSSSDALQVGIDESGDLQVSLWTERGYSSVEFCSGMGGGGKSPNTRLALIALMVAMEADIASDSPLPKGEST